MSHLNALFLVQAALIIVGVAFQIIAVTALRGNTTGPQGGEIQDPRETWQQKKAEMQQRRVTPSARVPTHRGSDYYEMEQTPAGVRPGDLAKTAKVKFVNDFKAPPPTQEEGVAFPARELAARCSEPPR